MSAFAVLAALCVLSLILIAVISMFGAGGVTSTATEERMRRRQAKIDRERAETASVTPIATASRRSDDDLAA